MKIENIKKNFHQRHITTSLKSSCQHIAISLVECTTGYTEYTTAHSLQPVNHADNSVWNTSSFFLLCWVGY